MQQLHMHLRRHELGVTAVDYALSDLPPGCLCGPILVANAMSYTILYTFLALALYIQNDNSRFLPVLRSIAIAYGVITP